MNPVYADVMSGCVDFEKELINIFGQVYIGTSAKKLLGVKFENRIWCGGTNTGTLLKRTEASRFHNQNDKLIHKRIKFYGSLLQVTVHKKQSQSNTLINYQTLSFTHTVRALTLEGRIGSGRPAPRPGPAGCSC